MDAICLDIAANEPDMSAYCADIGPNIALSEPEIDVLIAPKPPDMLGLKMIDLSVSPNKMSLWRLEKRLSCANGRPSGSMAALPLALRARVCSPYNPAAP